MKYPVIKEFRDKFTKQIYKVGVIFQSDDEARIKDLQTRKLIGKAIEEPKQEPKQETKQELKAEPKHVGGGIYELPNGERVRGKEAAIEAMNGGVNDDIQRND